MKALVTILASTLIVALVLSGAHAKDVAASSQASIQPEVQKVTHEEVGAKAVAELHNHVDKQTGKNLVGDNPLADNRSLKIREKNQQDIKKVLNKLVKSWKSNFLASLA